MFAVTDIDIVNLALGQLYEDEIQSFSERTKQASIAKRFYRQSVAAVLSGNVDWSFARTFAQGVALDGVSLRPGWTHVFAYPNDALRIRGIAEDYASPWMPNFEVGKNPVLGKVIYAGMSPTVFVYTRDVIDDATAFDASFVDALMWYLAMKMCRPFGKGSELKDLVAMYKEAMLSAASTDLNEGTRAPTETDPDNLDAPWIAAR